MHMQPSSKQLVSVLDELIESLEKDGFGAIADILSVGKTRILNSDYSGVEKVISAYAGQGSLNDIFAKDISNPNFENLRDRAWELADELRKDEHRGT